MEVGVGFRLGGGGTLEGIKLEKTIGKVKTGFGEGRRVRSNASEAGGGKGLPQFIPALGFKFKRLSDGEKKKSGPSIFRG